LSRPMTLVLAFIIRYNTSRLIEELLHAFIYPCTNED
jgi:hypothetical protein